MAAGDQGRQSGGLKLGKELAGMTNICQPHKSALTNGQWITKACVEKDSVPKSRPNSAVIN